MITDNKNLIDMLKHKLNIKPKNEELALLGGRPVRTKEFRSKPFIDKKEINLVKKLMRDGTFSRFVGSPLPGTRESLTTKSTDLELGDSSSSFLGGKYVKTFESKWSEILGVDYSISVNSATTGLVTALLALDLEPGSEVITTPFSFTATAAAIVLAGCVPIFCDIDPETFCLSPEKLKETITSNSKCVIAVHWCGNAGDFDEIVDICKKNKIKLVEDSAQAPGTMYRGKNLGCWGDMGVFSFNEPKNIMTGEGGMIVTNNPQYAKKARLIRNHGEAIMDESDEDHEIINIVGSNYRLTEIQAAIGVVQVSKLNFLNSIRNRNYKYLNDKLLSLNCNYLKPQKITHNDSFSAYTAAFRWNSSDSGVHRDIILEALIGEGIPAFKGYPRLMSEQPMNKRKIGYGSKPWGKKDKEDKVLSNAEFLVGEEFLGFFLMGWPNKKKDIDHIVFAFEKIINNLDSLRKYNSKNTDFILGRK
tara:strand:+ start:23385 stop:24809 length:1425 start_codon:yes stop_codon:yes gene_type:complete